MFNSDDSHYTSVNIHTLYLIIYILSHLLDVAYIIKRFYQIHKQVDGWIGLGLVVGGLPLRLEFEPLYDVCLTRICIDKLKNVPIVKLDYVILRKHTLIKHTNVSLYTKSRVYSKYG